MHEIQNTKPATRQPARYELIDKDGKHVCESSSIETLRRLAAYHFPGQEQDRTGRGWDVQTVGCDR